MTAAKYASHISPKSTPQTSPIPGKPQVANSAGGYSFQVDDWQLLRRFLILGTEGGSYYAGEREMTIKAAECVTRCATADVDRAVAMIREVSHEGRAPKNDPAIFALAMIVGMKGVYAQKALAVLSDICRIGTHLFQFCEAVQHFRGWGRSLKNAVGQWYLTKDASRLAYDVTKYQSRNGWSHRDVLRLAKPVAQGDISAVMRWAVGKPVETDGVQTAIAAFEAAKKAENAKQVVSLIRDSGLVRECVPTQFLNDVSVWDALLEKMPMTAMVRNLGKMSEVGLLKPLSAASKLVSGRLHDAEAIKKARLHPLALLVAQKIYSQGHGMKGSLSWLVDPGVCSALDDSFYLAFQAIEPTNKRYLLGLDVSGSMGCGSVAGSPLTPRDASAAMAMVTMRSEPQTYCHGFSNRFRDLGITSKQSLPEVISKVSNLGFESTDCSLPMKFAMEKKLDVDAFVVYTDSETYAGTPHPSQALKNYRQKTGINAKLIVVGMVANKFTIADKDDPGMLDVVGFDTSAPAVMNEFIRD